jgi:pyruvate/2-oxoglutarate dehydrogenase complex dihydrolipoamide acyltransferase (E2) component
MALANPYPVTSLQYKAWERLATFRVGDDEDREAILDEVFVVVGEAREAERILHLAVLTETEEQVHSDYETELKSLTKKIDEAREVLAESIKTAFAEVRGYGE